jgi:hypothetical protein
METTNFTTAAAAHGPRLVAWLREIRVLLPDLGPGDVPVDRAPQLTASQVRRVSDWRRGARASFPVVDALLVHLDRHVSELPDDVWLPASPFGRTREPA